MVASSGANLFASCAAGVCALWGPLHGGANAAVIEMLQYIHDSGISVKDYVAKVKDKTSHIKLMGFGHRVYKNYDPRAKIIKQAADRVLNKLKIHDPMLDLARSLEDALRREVLALVRHHGTHPTSEWSGAACRRFLRRLGEDGLDLARWAAFRLADQRAKGLEVEAREREHAAILARLQAVAAAAPPLTLKALALDGAALMALAGRGGGPWLGDLQRYLLDAVIEDPSLNTPDALAELARKRLESA